MKNKLNKTDPTVQKDFGRAITGWLIPAIFDLEMKTHDLDSAVKELKNMRFDEPVRLPRGATLIIRTGNP